MEIYYFLTFFFDTFESRLKQSMAVLCEKYALKISWYADVKWNV